MSKKEEKAMRQQNTADRASANARYDKWTTSHAPERADALNKYNTNYTGLNQGYGNLAKTGGIDAAPINDIYKDVGSRYKNFADTGGMNSAYLNGQFGDVYKGYGDFAKTGGLSPEDIGNIRSRSNAGISSTFTNLRDNLQRGAARQGGFAPGYGATMAKFGRDEAQANADTSRDTELGIKQAVNQGKLAGLGGMGTTTAQQSALEQAIAQHKLAGIAGM